MDAAHVRLLQVMDDVHTIVSRYDDIDPMLDALLDRMLDIMGCDRAWLLYPCDPSTPTWTVPRERTRPAWPGAYAQNLEIPMEDSVRYVFQAALDSDGPVTFDAASRLQVPPEITQRFGVQSQMILGVHPKTDRPWMLGIHHCERNHVFTDEDRNLFASIGRRLGDSLSTLIALRDLRESEANLERAVRERTAELQRTNEELRAFSYSVSHDLRASIRQIKGFSEILADHVGDALDAEGREYLDYVVKGTVRMDEIVRSLLRLSRATRSDLERARVDVARMIAEIHEELRRDAPERKVEMSLTAGIELTADPPLLRIALENILENAWKYTARRDVATIEVGASDDCTLYIRDNGVGFDMAHYDKLFRSFARLHSTREYAGTGIGLATVQRIVSRHGGRVWAESEVDGGATFYLSIPAPS